MESRRVYRRDYFNWRRLEVLYSFMYSTYSEASRRSCTQIKEKEKHSENTAKGTITAVGKKHPDSARTPFRSHFPEAFPIIPGNASLKLAFT